ncbi:hypothetical protein ACFLXQ_05010 [Chloroflexota bacterium]
MFARIRSRYYLIYGLLLLLAAVGIWLLAGRLSLFQTSSYISLFGLDSAKGLYQENVLKLAEGSEARQDFVSTYPGLYQVSVFLASSKGLDRDITITFHLKENCTSPNDLRQVTTTIPKTDIEEDDIFYPFTFTPIDESTGQTYCFVLEPVQVSEKEYLGVWASRADVYSEGKAFYQTPPIEDGPDTAEVEVKDQSTSEFNHQIFLPIVQASPSDALPSSFDVGFQLHYNGRPLDTISVFMTRLVSYKPYFWGSPGFYVFMLIVYLVGVFLLLRIRVD